LGALGAIKVNELNLGDTSLAGRALARFDDLDRYHSLGIWGELVSW
jgi:hypothetical protein